jgi:hypothetical protein
VHDIGSLRRDAKSGDSILLEREAIGSTVFLLHET